jgi:hypothetical protein
MKPYRGTRRAYDYSDIIWGDMNINPSGEEKRADPHEPIKAILGVVAAVLIMVAVCSLCLIGAAWVAFA